MREHYMRGQCIGLVLQLSLLWLHSNKISPFAIEFMNHNCYIQTFKHDCLQNALHQLESHPKIVNNQFKICGKCNQFIRTHVKVKDACNHWISMHFV